MQQSVQVFHALGKKLDKKPELSSSRALGISSSPKGPQPAPAIKPRLDTPCEAKGPQKIKPKPRKPVCSAEGESSSPSQYELPPPGKVKLVPLVFPTSDKPPTRPVPRRPRSLASRRPAVANPARPASNSAQSTAANSSQPNPASVAAPARPAGPTPTNLARPGWTNPTGPSVPQSAASRPAPYKTLSCTSFQRDPAHTAVPKPRTPPNNQNLYLLEDFALQPTPWRKPAILGPVTSTPITHQQRPEREAMKRKAQLEREALAKNSALGKYLTAREREMEISLYHGYA